VTSDADLLRDFAATGSEQAFTALVSRHANAVYAAAFRQTGNAHQAEEVMQAVFILLARKAPSLRSHGVLLGWLLQATRFAAADLLKAERRRRLRETAAFQMNLTPESATPSELDRLWDRVAPVLDACLARLRSADRDALLLRFFQNQSLAQVGEHLGVAEDAARKRVSRALDQLRSELAQAGAATPLTLLPEMLAREAVPGAPGGLVQPAVHAALAPQTQPPAGAWALADSVGAHLTWIGIRQLSGALLVAALLLGGGIWTGHWLRNSPSLESPSAVGDYRPAGFPEPQVVHAFIRQVQRDLRAGNRDAVVNQLQFPLRLNGPGFHTVLTSPDLVTADFERIFTESVAGELLKCPAESLHCTPQGVMIGSGSIWIARDPNSGQPKIAVVNLP
jgi:RNA polymerase sigma factor (sigma-70 family)